MRRLTLLTLLLLAGSGHALGLQEALAAAFERPDVVTTAADLNSARNDLGRTEQDPLALRMDHLEARQQVELLQAQLRQSVHAEQAQIAGAYTAVVEAREGLAVARQGVELSETALEVASIRFRNGSATELDVEEARLALDEARQGALTATDGLAVATRNLTGLLGREVDPEELQEVPDAFVVEPPSLNSVLASVSEHPTLVQAGHGVELAQAGLEMLHPSYAPRAQIENTEVQLANAREMVGEARRGFELQARSAHMEAKNAMESYRIELERLATQQARLEQQERRLAAGLVSELEVRQNRLQTAQARLTALQARHAVVTSLLELRAATMVDLPGPYETVQVAR